MSEVGAETRFVRERAGKWLAQNGFEMIRDDVRAGDGWRAEMIGKAENDSLVICAHKPDDAPYLTLECVLEADVPVEAEAWLDLLDRASDFDVAIWFDRQDTPTCRLSDRILVSGLNDDDFGFVVANLMACSRDVRRSLNRDA